MATITAEAVKQRIQERVKGKIVACHDETGHHYKFVDSGNIVDSVTQRNILDKPHLVPWAIGLAIEFLEEGNRFERLSDEKERKDLIKAAKLQYTDVRDNAGTIGGQAHEAIEEYVFEWMETGIQPDDILRFLYDRQEVEPMYVNGIQFGTKRRYFKGDREIDFRAIGAARSAEAAFKFHKVVPVACEILVGVDGVGAGTLDLLVLNQKGELELWDWKSSNNVNDFYAIQVSTYCKFFEKMTGLKVKRCKIFKIDKLSDTFKAYDIPQVAKAYEAFKHLSKVYEWTEAPYQKLVEDKTHIYGHSSN